MTAGSPVRRLVGNVPIVLVREDNEIHALTATCTHAGGPLDEGTVVGGCLRYPWHGSEFRLRDGTVRRGPATHPQPTWDVKVQGYRLLVRPTEPRR